MKEILLNKKVLYGLSAIVMVAAAVTLGTGAFFSDTETSQANVFTAGAIDLQIDSQASYNGDPVAAATWGLKDLVPTADKFFNFADIKPGDYGENTISLHVINNDAWVCAEVSGLASDDNGLTEPEGLVDSSDGSGNGELDDFMVWTIWRDDGAGSGGVEGDNVQNGTEEILASGNPVNGVLPIYDSTTVGGPLLGGDIAYLGVSWSLPGATGNEVQTDSLTGDISFNVVQSRNNGDYRCIPASAPEIISVQSSVFNFSGTGWAGWSCPSTHPNIVSANTTNCSLALANSLAWEPGASVGSSTYPTTPTGYTYASGEEGWILQNGGTSQSCYIILSCQAN